MNPGINSAFFRDANPAPDPATPQPTHRGGVWAVPDGEEAALHAQHVLSRAAVKVRRCDLYVLWKRN